MIYVHGRHSVPIVCLCPFYLCCKSCCWGFKTIHWCTFSWLVSCFNWCFVACLVFHGLLEALMNAQVGPKGVLALCNSLGILARTTMNFILMNGRWFSLMCHFHMCCLLLLVLSSSYCFCSISFDVSKLYGITGPILSSPSFTSLGWFMIVLLGALPLSSSLAWIDCICYNDSSFW